MSIRRLLKITAIWLGLVLGAMGVASFLGEEPQEHSFKYDGFDGAPRDDGEAAPSD